LKKLAFFKKHVKKTENLEKIRKNEQNALKKIGVFEENMSKKTENLEKIRKNEQNALKKLEFLRKTCHKKQKKHQKKRKKLVFFVFSDIREKTRAFFLLRQARRKRKKAESSVKQNDIPGRASALLAS